MLRRFMRDIAPQRYGYEIWLPDQDSNLEPTD